MVPCQGLNTPGGPGNYTHEDYTREDYIQEDYYTHWESEDQFKSRINSGTMAPLTRTEATVMGDQSIYVAVEPSGK